MPELVLVGQKQKGASYRYLAFKRPLCRVDVFNVTAEMIWPVEGKKEKGTACRVKKGVHHIIKTSITLTLI